MAVLGLGLRLPADIEDPDSLWAFLHAGRDAAAPVDDAGHSVALLTEHDTFEPGYFWISPREAAAMDPQHRMILEVTDRAFQDAAVPLGVAATERVGVFAGTGSDDYLLQSGDLGRRGYFDHYTGIGTARAAAAGRVGHVFGFTGPAVHVDTACSSSLVALHLAIRSLRDRECELAVVAAANLIAAPQNRLLREASGALAPGGRCRPFAEDAEGFGQGEGALAVLLQPLDAALAAGRRPLAVVRGSAVNHNGRGAGLTIPRLGAQHQVIADALRAAGVRPDEIDFVEAHGTGTELGDPIEVAALAEVYRDTGPIQLGSVKSNFGHLEAAAGLLSLAKVLVCLEHRGIAPTLHVGVPSPRIPWDRTPFRLTVRPTDWPATDRPRRAAISSFGMTGTNVHVVVEEHRPRAVDRPCRSGPSVLLLSAKSPWALHGLAAAYRDRLASLSDAELDDLCATAATGRDHHPFRLVVVARDVRAAAAALDTWRAGRSSPEIAVATIDPDDRIALVVDSGTDAENTAAQVEGIVAGQPPPIVVGPPEPAGRHTRFVTVDGPTVVTSQPDVDRVLTELPDRDSRLAVALYLLGTPVDWRWRYPPGSFAVLRLPTHPYRRRGLWVTQPVPPPETDSETDSAPLSPDEGKTTMTVTAADSIRSPLDEITGWVAELLGLTPAEVDVRQPLLELGADSLVFVELVGLLDATYGVEVVIRQLFEELLTVDALASYVIEHAPTQVEKPPAAEEAVGPPPADTQPEPVPLRTDRGRDGYLADLTATYTRMTARSIADHRAHLPVMCNNRRSASEVRPETEAFQAPLRVVSSDAAHIVDVDGNDYVDIAMGFGVNLFGHQAPFIVDALRGQLALGMQIGPESATAGEVAGLIAELTGMSRVLFCNSGTEAVMTMIRLARAHSSRRTVAVFRNSYHGHFDSTLVNPASVRDVSAVPLAIGIPPGLVDDVIVLPYADQRALDEIRARAGELAAVLVEPVQNRRPDLHPARFLRDLRSITQDNGVLLAFDEVLTGFRIHPGGAAAHFGVQPDVASYAKVLGGGMPIGVVAGRADVMDRVDAGGTPGGPEVTYTAGTFCRHPLAMATALAVLRRLKSDGVRITAELNERTDRMRERLDTGFERLAVPLSAHNFGSFFRFAINANLSFAHQPLEMDYFNAAMLTKGVYIAEGGTCFLSTAHTDTDIDRIVDAALASARELRDAGFFAQGGDRPPSATVVRAPAAASLGASAVPAATQARAPERVTAQAPATPADSRAPRAPQLSLSFFGDYPPESGTDVFEVLSTAARTVDGTLAALWIPERHFHSFGGFSPNPAVFAAFLAATTSTIQLRAGSVVLPLHDPVRVAEDWSMVDRMSGGRVGLAFASGWQRNDFVLAREPFDRRREVMWRDIEVVRALWRGEPVERTAGSFSSDVRLFPRPQQAEVPIWIAALGTTETFRRAGQLGLSVLTNLVGQTHEQLSANIAEYRAAYREAGFTGPGQVTALVHTLVADDGSAVDQARTPLRRYFGSSVDLLTATTGSSEQRSFDRLSDGDRAYLLDRAVERYIEHNAMIGDLHSAVTTATRIAALGVDEIACFVDFGVPATVLLDGVERLLTLPSRFTRTAPEQEPEPVRPNVTVTAGSRAVADLVGAFGADEIDKAVTTACTAVVDIDTAVSRFDRPAVHVVDLTLLGDADQEEQVVDFHRFDQPPDDEDTVWQLTLMLRQDSRATLVAAVRPPVAPALSARTLLDAVVSGLSDIGGHASSPVTDENAAGDVVVETSANEQLMWLACQADPEIAPAYSVRTTLELHGSLDIDRLQEAVDRVAARHEALRATVDADGAHLIVHPELIPTVHVVDLSALSDADRTEELAQWYDEDAAKPFDLDGGLLWRVTVLRLGEQHHRIVVAVHHIVYDGRSERIVLDDLARAYNELAGSSTEPAPQPVSFVDRRRDGARPDEAADRAFWQQALAGRPAAQDVRSTLVGGPGARLRRSLPADTVTRLREVGAAAGCTPYGTLLACYAVLLTRSTGESDVTIGVSADRRDPRAQRGLVGYLSNLLPVRIALSGAAVAEALPIVRAALLDAQEHQDLPFARIIEAATRQSDGTRHGPLVWTSFNWDHATTPRFAGADTVLVPDPAAFVRFDLSLNVVDTDQGTLDLEWDYSVRAHDAESVAELAHRFEAVVAELAAGGPANTLHGRVSAAAARFPGRVAAYDRSTSITYGDLDRCSDLVARALLARGPGGDAVITVVGATSVPLLVALLGVTKAGAAFTVVPPETPAPSLAAWCAATGSPLVVHVESTDPEQVTLAGLLAEQHESVALPDVDASAAAYVISTSGSSGAPKPVVVEHAALLSYLDALADRIDLAGRTALVVSSPTHDLGYTTLWSALTTGGALLLADHEAATDPELLTELCSRQPAAVLKIAPTHLDALLHGGQDGFLPSEHLVLGGEPLRWELVDRVRGLRPGLTVWNHYGPTETTVGATLYRIADPDPWHDRATVPIGTALNGPVRVADDGELLVAGPGLARGYLGMPDETAARFRWHDEPDGRTRWYHTGDVVTELPTGELEFLGRDDDQVTVRGHRVELGAVDDALGRVPGVLAAASCLVGEGGNARIMAGAVLAPTTTPRAVLAELATTVPGELVPSGLVPLPRLPRTAAGKLDRVALAALVASPPATDDSRLGDMTRIWSDVLENGSVTPDDDFFELGGNSIHAIKIVARVRQSFGRRVPVRKLFELPTPRALYGYAAGAPETDNGRTGH